jgi:hypothetical protein
MPEVAVYLLIASAPLFALLALVAYHRARRTPGGLDAQFGWLYALVQLVLVGLLAYSLHLRAFGDEVQGRLVGGRDRLGGSTTTTELSVELGGGEVRSFHFASRVPTECKAGMTLHKPAYSTTWTCASEPGSTHPVTLQHDADPKGFWLAAALVGAAFLLFVGRT